MAFGGRRLSHYRTSMMLPGLINMCVRRPRSNLGNKSIPTARERHAASISLTRNAAGAPICALLPMTASIVNMRSAFSVRFGHHTRAVHNVTEIASVSR